mgnify:CR=1 FL=1
MDAICDDLDAEHRHHRVAEGKWVGDTHHLHDSGVEQTLDAQPGGRGEVGPAGQGLDLLGQGRAQRRQPSRRRSATRQHHGSGRQGVIAGRLGIRARRPVRLAENQEVAFTDEAGGLAPMTAALLVHHP